MSKIIYTCLYFYFKFESFNCSLTVWKVFQKMLCATECLGFFCFPELSYVLFWYQSAPSGHLVSVWCQAKHSFINKLARIRNLRTWGDFYREILGATQLSELLANLTRLLCTARIQIIFSNLEKQSTCAKISQKAN